jgi:hypothetical protein
MLEDRKECYSYNTNATLTTYIRIRFSHFRTRLVTVALEGINNQLKSTTGFARSFEGLVGLKPNNDIFLLGNDISRPVTCDGRGYFSVHI